MKNGSTSSSLMYMHLEYLKEGEKEEEKAATRNNDSKYPNLIKTINQQI